MILFLIFVIVIVINMMKFYWHAVQCNALQDREVFKIFTALKIKIM